MKRYMNQDWELVSNESFMAEAEVSIYVPNGSSENFYASNSNKYLVEIKNEAQDITVLNDLKEEIKTDVVRFVVTGDLEIEGIIDCFKNSKFHK